jgi:serine protein kinase
MQDETSARGRIEQLATAVAQDFESTRRVLSFEEWFELLCQAPHVHARNAAQYMRDCFDFYGGATCGSRAGRSAGSACSTASSTRRGRRRPGWSGRSWRRTRSYEAIDGFVRIGRVNKLLLLHGPNGSAKTTFLDAVMRALEAYSQTDGGALYRFSWVFPNKTARSGGIGFGASPWDGDEAPETTYARLSAEAVDAKLSDENKDPPVYLLPLAMREQVLVDILANARQRAASDPSGAARCGSSRGQRAGAARRPHAAQPADLRRAARQLPGRPAQGVPARAGRAAVPQPALPGRAGDGRAQADGRRAQLPGDGRARVLEPAAGVGGQVLYATQGDLVDANRGMINFSDLLKRPYEHYKYLLTATESGVVALDHVVLALDMVFAARATT